MDSIKYIGLDVHQHSISVAVLNAEGKLVLQLVMATHAATIVDFVQGLRGSLPSAGVETSPIAARVATSAPAQTAPSPPGASEPAAAVPGPG